MQAKNKKRLQIATLDLQQLKTKHHVVAHVEADLLRRIRADESMSRVELARQLKLAPSTAGIYVDRLIADGFLVEKEKVARDFGRPPKALGLNPDGGRFVGVDFEARNLMATAVDFSQKPLKQYRDSIQPSDSVEAILAKIETAISDVVDDDKRPVLGIGLGVPGSVDHEKGVALHYRHIAGWENIPLAERLHQRFGVPVFLENNIRSMALAELWFGQGRSIQNFICIGIRSGIGAGIIIDGHLYRGTNNIAGEIADWPCIDSTTANVVRLEDVVSLRALKAGSSEKAAKTLALVLCQLYLAFNPERVVMTGNVTSLGNDFVDLLNREIIKISRSPELPQIVNSTLGDFNGALGAAALAVHQWKPVRK